MSVYPMAFARPQCHGVTGGFNDSALGEFTGQFGYLFDGSSVTADTSAFNGAANVINDDDAGRSVALTGPATAGGHQIRIYIENAIQHSGRVHSNAS